MTSLGGSCRRRGLTDIVPQYDDKKNDKISDGSADVDQKNNTSISSIKVHHFTNITGQGYSRFPKLEECAHFHYEHVELNSLQLSLYDEDLKSLSSLEHNENSENKWLTVKVVSQGQSWLLHRTYENFRVLDQQLHQCIYDRKFSLLPELPPSENLPDKQNAQTYIKCQLNKYCERFSLIAGNLINCGPVLSWLQLDNRGRRILITDGDSCPINTPAVAAAYAIQKYSSVAADEISFDVGDMISVIDMPPPEDSIWWRGKRGFMVGFFPSHCVAVITDKVPCNLQLNQYPNIIEPSKPVLRKHGKLIAFFRAFILSRPSRRHLKQSGILKERVFGCDLGEHLLNSRREIPMVLKCCSEFIEKYGIVDGIYRLSGATSNIQKLRLTFDEDRIPTLYNDDSILQDIHSVASLLKMYFRELPNPLCTYQLYKNFVNAVQNSNPVERVAFMRDAVQKLPPPHFRTLEFLMRHLSRVAEHGTRTGMTARNIAIVWAPNLLRCKELEFGGVAALQGVGVQAVVTEFLISNVDLVFSNDNNAIQGTSRRVRPKSLSFGVPTKLLTLEEAQNKKVGSESSNNNYIEVGGGPACLPKLYHTVIELPHRKRLPLKRSPLGWKSIFTRSGSTVLRKSSLTNSNKRKTSPSIEKSFPPNETLFKAESETRNRLRMVKSAESLSGVSNRASAFNSICLEYLSTPLSKLPISSGHTRSVSHDSYFDYLAENMTMHSTVRQNEGLSDLQVNFNLDESEMKIFSEDSSQIFVDAFSSANLPDTVERHPLLASAENTIIVDPSPKKHKTSDSSLCSSITLSDDMTAVSNKRSRLEERLLNEDFAYIDSNCDRLIVEVDVHRRESPRTLSPLTDPVLSDNNLQLTSSTMSDSIITNDVTYTPLSEYSCTNNSNFVPSYQALSSSTSSTQHPRSSTESMKTDESKKYNNVSGNRFSYPGEMPTTYAPTVRNRLSLQTLSSSSTPDGRHNPIHVSASYANKENNCNINITCNEPKCDISCKENELSSRQLHYKCDSKSSDVRINDGTVSVEDTKKTDRSKINNYNDITHESSCSGHHPDGLSERLDWKTDEAVSSCSDEQVVQEPQSIVPYGNTPQLKLILNDKDMFSESIVQKAQNNESPYEFVTMVGNRMTPISYDENVTAQLNEKRTSPVNESTYEEVKPISLNLKMCPDYEEMSSEFTENEIYNCKVGSKTFPLNKKSNYEVVSLMGDNVSDFQCMSSNESSGSSMEDAMIENHLYDSLIAEDFSPESRSNTFPKITNTSVICPTNQCADLVPYENLLDTSNISVSNSEAIMRNASSNTSPLSKFDDAQLACEDKPQKSAGCESNLMKVGQEETNLCDVMENNSDNLKNSSDMSLGSCAEFNVKMKENITIEDRCNLPQSISIENNLDNGDRSEDYDNECNNSDGRILNSVHAKSVQDLVLKFEWSVEQDTDKKDHSILPRSGTSPQLACNLDKKEYVSLPPITAQNGSNDDPSKSIDHEMEDKDGEVIRRNRIEKYKEERRLALRQRYNVDDDGLNDKKDEEMIRRFKQKIVKSDKTGENDLQTHINFNSSPTNDNEQLLAKDMSGKSPTAVTTISILYKSRRRLNLGEVDSNSDDMKMENELGSEQHVSLENCRKFSSNEPRELRDSLMSKSCTSAVDQTKDHSLKNAGSEHRKPFTSSLERKVKSFVRQESLVAKRVNQLTEASESSELACKRFGESGAMRRRANSTSSPISQYCIRDIAAIFENKDNK